MILLQMKYISILSALFLSLLTSTSYSSTFNQAVFSCLPSRGAAFNYAFYAPGVDTLFKQLKLTTNKEHVEKMYGPGNGSIYQASHLDLLLTKGGIEYFADLGVEATTNGHINWSAQMVSFTAQENGVSSASFPGSYFIATLTPQRIRVGNKNFAFTGMLNSSRLGFEMSLVCNIL